MRRPRNAALAGGLRCFADRPTYASGHGKRSARTPSASANMRRFAEDLDVPLAMPVLHTDLPRPAALPHRQGARRLRPRRRARCMVATDRISAFDYVLGTGIPDKGKVLTQLSAFWFEQLRDIVPNHLLTLDVDGFPAGGPRLCRPAARAASMLVQRKTDPCQSSAWRAATCPGRAGRNTRETGAVCGIELPAGLQESDRCRRRSSRRRPRRSRATTRTSPRLRPAPLVGADLFARLRDADAGAVRSAAPRTPRRAASSWRTPSSSSALLRRQRRCC